MLTTAWAPNSLSLLGINYIRFVVCFYLAKQNLKILEAMNRTLRLALKVFIWSYRLRLECWTMLSFRWRFQALKKFGLVLTLEWNRNAQNIRCVYMRMNWIFLVFCLNHHKTMLVALSDDQLTNWYRTLFFLYHKYTH